jgi:hypothetical protein
MGMNIKRNAVGGYGLDSRGSSMAGSCDCGNEPSSFIKGGDFLDKLSEC